MTALGERVLIQHLVDPDALDVLAREGLSLEVIPTEEMRRVYSFAVDYYFDSGMTKAPSIAVLKAEYGDLLDDNEVDIETEPEDSVEWAIEDLKGTYAYRRTAQLNKALAAAMAEAETADRVEVVSEFGSEFVRLAMELESRESHADARVSMAERLLAYEAREADHETIYGMRLGQPRLDAYTRGIHPGELAVLAAGPKVGKSYLLDLVALREWQAGKTVTLFTLENSVEMTLDRIACLATGVPSTAWQHGECSPEQVSLVRGWVEEVKDADTGLHVIQPPPGERTVVSMVRRAQLLGSDSLLLDQLTFIEPRDERAPRHLQIREMTHDLKTLISTGRNRMPCLLAHQVNREGVKAADKVGHLEMYHLAEGSEVERTADWVFGLYRSRAQLAVNRAIFQTLAVRRAMPLHFEMTWDVDAGFINVRGELELVA